MSWPRDRFSAVLHSIVAAVDQSCIAGFNDTVLEEESDICHREAPYVRRLARLIYGRYYADISIAKGRGAGLPSDFGCWSSGWRVHQKRSDNCLLIERGTELQIVEPGSYRASGAPNPPRVGDGVEVWETIWTDKINDNFRYFFSNIRGPWDDFYERRRFYFHARVEARLEFASLLAATLRRHAIPFVLKAERDPRVCRQDGVVLYVSEAVSLWVAELLRTIVDTNRAALSPTTSPFVFQLFPGVAVADGPAGGESFGRYVSTAIARGLIIALEDGADTPAEKLQSVQSSLKIAGVNESTPWRLRPDSTFPIDEILDYGQ